MTRHRIVFTTVELWVARYQIAGPAAIPYAVAAIAGGLALRLGERHAIPSTVVVATAAVGLSAVVSSTYTEYGVAVAVAVVAAAIGLVGGAVSGLRDSA